MFNFILRKDNLIRNAKSYGKNIFPIKLWKVVYKQIFSCYEALIYIKSTYIVLVTVKSIKI